MNEEILHIVDQIIAEKGSQKDAVIPILQEIQLKFKYLPQKALERVCDTTSITASQIQGIATFYTQFRHQPVGQHIIRVCVGTACHVKGAMLVYDALVRELKLEEGKDTDSQGCFTLEKVACLGCCTLAPVVQIDDVTYGHVSPENVKSILDDFLHGKGEELDKASFLRKDRKSQGEIRIGLGSCCIASGSSAIKKELEHTLSRNSIEVDVKQVGCVGVCNQVPLLEIHKPGQSPTFYGKIDAKDVKEIVHRHFRATHPLKRFYNGVYHFLEKVVESTNDDSIHKYPSHKRDTPIAEFLDGQINIATENRGSLKPYDLDEYRQKGGFSALQQALQKMDQKAIIQSIKKSGLKGRGGAGFPTGIKWELVSNSTSDCKYVICNGDEGDPGAFMDRMLLESYPFRIIEGMLIAAFAVGAEKGLFYIRAEYPLAVERIKEAISICEKNKILGKNILGSGFSFIVNVFEGAGAFICGEETALIASVEGKRGMPKVRPPYPSEQGLWGKPTLINNTETFSMVPWIIREGYEKFNSIGTELSKGTKVFALAGKVKRGGLIEVPMGISIRDIVEKIGGGIDGGRKFKAVQIGGPSGGCIPASMADIQIDFESLKKAGAMMGSGGMIVLDENDCMVDIARYFLAFTQDQSCGKCTFCRIGTRRMLDIMDRITTGKGKMNDLVELEDLANATMKGSICGLGITAPNPVLSTLKYFREEYIAHIEGQCPTGKCKEMVSYRITDDCFGCTKCAQACPVDAIEFKPYERHEIDTEKCIKCDICRELCPVDAVIVK